MNLTVRSINPDELPLFAATTHMPERIGRFSEMVAAMWASGESRPEWCFLIEKDDKPLGRLGYMKLDGRADAVTLFGWTLPWDGDYLSLGAKLFTNSLVALRQQGVQLAQRELHAGWGTLDQQRQTLEAAGFAQLQGQHVYKYDAAAGCVALPHRLRFESLATVGDGQMKAVMAQVIADTPDQNIQHQIEQLGLEQFVARDYDMLKREHELQPNWWCLAHAVDGALVGLFQSVKFKQYNEGNVAFLGALPAQRGKGYGHELLAAATNVLLDAGVELIIGRTDALNIPMQRTFRKVGYQLATQIWTYQQNL